MKSWAKSKTMWVGFAVGILGVVQSTLESAPMDAQTSGMVMGAIGAVMMFLRTITTQPIGKA